MTNILAFDLSTVKTGVAAGNETRIFFTEITQRTATRDMAACLRHYTRDKAFDLVVIEDIYLGKNPHTFKELARLQGAVREQADRMLIPVLFVSTAEVDLACGIPLKLRWMGRKEHTRRIAQALLPDREMSEDECDAVCVLVWAQGKAKEMDWAKGTQ